MLNAAVMLGPEPAVAALNFPTGWGLRLVFSPEELVVHPPGAGAGTRRSAYVSWLRQVAREATRAADLMTGGGESGRHTLTEPDAGSGVGSGSEGLAGWFRESGAGASEFYGPAGGADGGVDGPGARGPRGGGGS